MGAGQTPPLTYRDAGVDIDSAEDFVERIGRRARSTAVPGVLGGVGGFAAAFRLADAPAFQGLTDPVLVSGTDGVGTKLKLAFALGAHATVGIDLVAMCVNDVVTTGASPLFFLDYFGTGRLDVEVGTAVIEGVVQGCQRAGCALVGGETAELPGLYRPGEYDLAGFAVGVVDRTAMVTGANVVPGDRIVAVHSRGLHSNGYSLAQKALLDVGGHGLADPWAGGSLGEALLTPTPIYADLVRRLMASVRPKAMAHITGGGLPGNVPRVLPPGVVATIDRQSWSIPPLFRHIAAVGGVAEDEMFRTFNMGIGYVIVVDASQAAETLEVIRDAGETGAMIGEVAAAAHSASRASLRWTGLDDR